MFRCPTILRGILYGLGCAAAVGTLSMPARAANPAPDQKSTFTVAQRAELKRLIHDYIVENPEVINEAVVALQAKDDAARDEKQKSTIAARRQELMDPAEGTVIGNPKGDVTIVEFFDYNCGYCKSMFPAMMETLKEDGKVRLVLKEFPILAPSSVTASKAALAAVKQNKYADLHVAMLGHKGSLSDETIMDLAKNAGLDIPRLQADMKAPEIDKIIARNNELASALQVNGTPAVIVGKTFVAGAIGKDKLKELIAAARAKS
ncbi:MAG: DsbA family protein [Rhodospirillaceae bacterium]|nr:MAG: DsbA family protein [Rhodospirillaceae bacterium]